MAHLAVVPGWGNGELGLNGLNVVDVVADAGPY